MNIKKLRQGFLQAVIVLVPTYLVAYFTDKMVYTIPMLAASSFIAASISSRDTKLKVDDDTEGSDGSDS